MSQLVDADTQIQGEQGIRIMFKIKIEFQQFLDMLKTVGQCVPVNEQFLRGLLDIKGIVKILLQSFKEIGVIGGIIFNQRRDDIDSQLPEIL